jgi:hypothetical protein
MSRDPGNKVHPDEMNVPDPLMEEFARARLNMKLYTYKLKAELCATDPHYVRWGVKKDDGDPSEDPEYVLAYETPNWGTRQRARQDLGAHLGIKPSDKVDVDLKKPLYVELVEQPGCPEVPIGADPYADEEDDDNTPS